MQTSQEPVSAPWWKYGHMWLVVSGPAIVVVAGFFTLYLAISRPDPVYTDVPRLTVTQPEAALAPAMQARNHAATGASPPQRP